MMNHTNMIEQLSLRPYMVCNGECVLYDGLDYDKAITQAQSSLKHGGYKSLTVRQAIPTLYTYTVTYLRDRNAYCVLPMSCSHGPKTA